MGHYLGKVGLQEKIEFMVVEVRAFIEFKKKKKRKKKNERDDENMYQVMSVLEKMLPLPKGLPSQKSLLQDSFTSVFFNLDSIYLSFPIIKNKCRFVFDIS